MLSAAFFEMLRVIMATVVTLNIMPPQNLFFIQLYLIFNSLEAPNFDQGKKLYLFSSIEIHIWTNFIKTFIVFSFTSSPIILH
jgi:hypothetical protein